MKRIIPILLVLVLLLSACASLPTDESSSVPDSSGSDASVPEAPFEPTKQNTLLDNKEPYSDSLWYLPNATVEGMTYPTLKAFGENLLLTSLDYGNMEDIRAHLVLISGQDGQVLNEITIPVAEAATPQILGNTLAICNNVAGTITLLDAQLNTTSEFTLPANTASWYLGTDLDTVFEFSYTDGGQVWSISRGEKLSELPISEVSPSNSASNEDIMLSCLNRDTLRQSILSLNLGTGSLVSLPFPGRYDAVSRSGSLWLASSYEKPDVYYFGSDASPKVLTVEDGTLSFCGDRLLRTGYNSSLTLYDSDLSFISRCDFSGLYLSNILWQENLGGYLLLMIDTSDQIRLYFWDTSTGMSGDPLPSQPFSDESSLPAGTSADADLYERAQEISERYGLQIRIADQCETEFSYFSAYQITDRDLISSGLDLLERALEEYPENFFEQLSYGQYPPVTIQFVAGLTATNGFGGDSAYTAFTQNTSIVVDLYSCGIPTFHHEFSHIIDSRLAFDAEHRSDALFSVEHWLELQPEDFSYTGTYDYPHENVQSDWYSYFIDVYAMTNATEDRARVFEYALDPEALVYKQSAGLRQKLQYYSDCIRDSFDTTGWPETTAWEKPLTK